MHKFVYTIILFSQSIFLMTIKFSTNIGIVHKLKMLLIIFIFKNSIDKLQIFENIKHICFRKYFMWSYFDMRTLLTTAITVTCQFHAFLNSYT